MTMQGSELKAIREALGWGQRKFAEEIGMTQSYIGQMERGERPIERRTELAARGLLLIKRQFVVVEGEGRFQVAKRFMQRVPSSEAMSSTYGGIVLVKGDYSRREDAEAAAAALNAEQGVG